MASLSVFVGEGAEIARNFGSKNALPNYPARFNIAPTDAVLTVRLNPKIDGRSLDALRWGLVPHLAKDLKCGARCINARAETVQTTPAFRDAFEPNRLGVKAVSPGSTERKMIPRR